MITINQILSIQKTVRERISDLKTLRTEVAKKESWMSDNTKKVEPTYDIRLADKKITELQNFLCLTDQLVKQSNSVTTVDFVVDLPTLLKPLE